MSAVGKVEIVLTSFAEVSAENERLRSVNAALVEALENTASKIQDLPRSATADDIHEIARAALKLAKVKP